jgi:hypothetical protein
MYDSTIFLKVVYIVNVLDLNLWLELDLVACTNLHKLIETYKVQDGPSPAEVKRALDARLKTCAETVIENSKTLAAVEITLNSAIMGCSLYSQ